MGPRDRGRGASRATDSRLTYGALRSHQEALEPVAHEIGCPLGARSPGRSTRYAASSTDSSGAESGAHAASAATCVGAQFTHAEGAEAEPRTDSIA
jgi:hypothetical protein